MRLADLPRRFLLHTIILVALGSRLAACSPSRAIVAINPTPDLSETAMNQSTFRVIAYATAAIVPEVIPYDRLTHINYAFLIPNADGSFAPFANSWKLKKIADEAHQNGVQVLISVGGWGWDEQFEAMAADPASRSIFVQNLTAFVDEYGLDGADIDWEYPGAGRPAQNFLALIRELRRAMPGKLLTSAVVSYGINGEGVLSETFDLFDFVNVMTYDGPDHGTMEQFEAGLEYWQGRGLSPEKTVMGAPFYARPSETYYRKIVETDPGAAYADSIEINGAANHYNGIPTIQAKTRLAMERAGGIMFWALDHDIQGELSLVRAIDQAVSLP